MKKETETSPWLQLRLKHRFEITFNNLSCAREFKEDVSDSIEF